MESKDRLLRFQGLKGKSVIARTESERLGTIEDLLFSPEDGRIGGVLISPEGVGARLGGLFGQRSAVRGDSIEAIGLDAIVITERIALVDADRLDRRGLVSASELKDRPVYTDAGERLDGMADVIVHAADRRVQSYAILRSPERGVAAAPGALGREVLVPVTSEVRIGREFITVPAKYVTHQGPTPQA